MFYYGLYKNKQKLYCVENINRGGSMQKAKTYLNKIFLTLAYALITLLNFIWFVLILRVIYLVIFDPSNLPISKEPTNIYWNTLFYILSSVFFAIILYRLYKNYTTSKLTWKNAILHYLIFGLYMAIFFMFFYIFSNTSLYQSAGL